MALKEYDFKKVALIIGGNQIKGFADGEAIVVEAEADDWAEYVGNDGEVTRSATNNKMGKITFKLAQSSESNGFLTGLLKGKSIIPAMVKDGSGLSLHVAEQAYIKRRPNSAYGREVSEREYIVVCPELIMNDAGN